MKRIRYRLTLCLLTTVLTLSAQHDAVVEKLLQQMTLEEKVGQMAQITVDSLMDNISWQLKDSMLQKGIVDYKIGSVLNTWNNVAHSKEEWHAVVSKLQNYTGRTRLKIPLVYGVDAIHGVTYTDKSTLFPQEIAQAATFNRQLVHRAAEICAYETRSCSLPWTFSPVLDLGLDPRWPRLWETFGEDPYLASALAIEITKGYQGEDADHIDKYHIMACAKHYF